MTVEQGGQADWPKAELLRKRLRNTLVAARREAGCTQKNVAEALDWSPSKVVRIEQGTVPVAPTDARAMLSHYGVTDRDQVNQLVGLAREAREARSLKEYEDILNSTFRDMISQEFGATSIWKHEPSVIPGHFQTASYAQALLRALGEHPKDVTRLAEVRMLRQSIFEVDPIPEMHVVIGEAALLRPIGDADIMREQVARLLELNERPEITLHLLPLAAGAHRGMGRSFTILQFRESDLNDSLYLNDGRERADSPESLGEISKHLNIYNELQEKAELTGTFSEHAQRFLDLYDQGGPTAGD